MKDEDPALVFARETSTYAGRHLEGGSPSIRPADGKSFLHPPLLLLLERCVCAASRDVLQSSVTTPMLQCALHPSTRFSVNDNSSACLATTLAVSSLAFEEITRWAVYLDCNQAAEDLEVGMEA